MSAKNPKRRRYDQTLSELGKKHPRLERPLRHAEKNRETHLASYLTGARLAGLEELLRHLELTAKSLKDGEGRGIAYLLTRANADFETALESALSGYANVAHEAMRDVMEIEFVLREFLEDPPSLEAWFKAPPKELHDRFRPALLRQRHANRQGKQPQDLSEATDYKGHSIFLHVNASSSPFAMKGLASANVPFGIDICFWEMFEHARRLVLVLHGLLETGRFPKARNPDPETKLPKFKEGWQRTQEMQQIFLALIEAAKTDEREPPNAD
jgi:hypothetical protein